MRSLTPIRAALVALLIGACLAACTESAPNNEEAAVPNTRPAPGATPTSVARRGGMATIGVVGELREINPAFGPSGLASTIFRPVVEGLFSFDPEGRPQPWLAETVPERGRGISDDGLVVIVRLRQGIAWEDGKPFVADDIVFTLAVGQNPANGFAPALADAFRTIRAADAIDAYTVRLTLTTPGDAYLRAFSPVFPAHLFGGATEIGTHPYTRAPFGTGPFRFAEWRPGELLALRRSPSYRLGDRPYFDLLIFRAFPNEAAAEAALREGAIDLLLSADGQQLTAPAGSAIVGIAPRSNGPPTWNAGDWYRDRP